MTCQKICASIVCTSCPVVFQNQYSIDPGKRKSPHVRKAHRGLLVREKRVELSLFRNWCLKPARLPFRHSRVDTYLVYQSAREMSIRKFDQNALGASNTRPGAAFLQILFNVLPEGVMYDLGIRAKEGPACSLVALQPVHEPGGHIAVRPGQHLGVVGAGAPRPQLGNAVRDEAVVFLLGPQG